MQNQTFKMSSSMNIFFLNNKWVQSKPLRKEMQTNKWICLKTRCVSCGFFGGFCGISVLGIMILEAVMGAEGQNRGEKVENEGWCCSVPWRLGLPGRSPPCPMIWLCQWKICQRGNLLRFPPLESLFLFFVDVLLLFQFWRYRSRFSGESMNWGLQASL